MIVVIGEALVDIIVDADGNIGSVVGGGPFNAARTIARLEQPVMFMGPYSKDPFGRRIAEALTSDNVVMAFPDAVDAPSTIALAQLDEGGAATYRFLFDGSSATLVTPEQALAALPNDLTAIHAGTLGLVFEPLASASVALVQHAPENVIVFIDPNCRPSTVKDIDVYKHTLEQVLPRADVIKVSGDDIEFLAPTATSKLEVAREWAKRYDAVVLLTDGADAVHVVLPGDEVKLDVPRVNVVDTVGAGDAFGGGFLSWWMQQGLGRDDLRDLASVRSAAEYGIKVAGMTCEREGAQPPHLAEVVS